MMTRWMTMLASLTLLTGIACGEVKGAEEPVDEGFKFYSLDEAFEIAAEEDKIVYTFVTATWCGWCRRMEKETLSNETVQKVLAAAFVPTQLITDKPTVWEGKRVSGEAVYQKLNSSCSGYPCGFFLKSNRQKYRFEDLSGFKRPDEFIQALRDKGPQSARAVIDDIAASQSPAS